MAKQTELFLPLPPSILENRAIPPAINLECPRYAFIGQYWRNWHLEYYATHFTSILYPNHRIFDEGTAAEHIRLRQSPVLSFRHRCYRDTK